MQIIDTDTHVREGYFLDEVYKLDGEFAHLSPKRVKSGAYHQVKFEHDLDPFRDVDKVGSHRQLYDPARWDGRIAAIQEGGIDMKRRVDDLEAVGVDKQVMFCTGHSIPTFTEGKLGLALSAAYNDWVHKLVAGYEDRIYPAAVLPTGHPEGLAGELRRCVRDLGFKAAVLAPYSLTRTLDDPAFDPCFEAAQELDVPLFFHPSSEGDLVNRFSNFYIKHTLARPTCASAALVALVLGGVFERFPRLRAAFFECNTEWMLFWMHRMDNTYEYLAPDYAPYLTMKPSDYVRRNCYLTCESFEPMLPKAIEEIGEERIMMSSDYPHWDTGYPNVVKEIQDRGDITARQKDLILSENATTLMRL